MVHLLELLNDWVVELSDPHVVLEHHRGLGLDIHSLDDLRHLDLEVLEQFTKGMARRWSAIVWFREAASARWR